MTSISFTFLCHAIQCLSGDLFLSTSHECPITPNKTIKKDIPNMDLLVQILFPTATTTIDERIIRRGHKTKMATF